jgi:DNA-binding transcriptional regulator YiaG
MTKKISMNNHVFKGHKTLLGNRYVTYAEIELPTRYNIYAKSKNGFDWGSTGSGALQLAFAILYQISNLKFAEENAAKYMNEVVKKLNSRDWILTTPEVNEWIDANTKVDEKVESEKLLPSNNTKETPKNITPKPSNVKPKRKKALDKPKTNIVKEVCKELEITQKQLAEILEVPEGTVSSWAVKDEIPRLGKKAIEFYIQNTKNQKIIDSYKSFVNLLQAS